MKSLKLDRRILVIAPGTFGFGFAVLEGPHRLIESGLVQVRGEKNAQCLERVEKLIRRYRPEVIITQHPTKSPRRHARVRELLGEIQTLSAQARTKYRGIPRVQVHKTFAEQGKTTKYAIAKIIAEKFVEMARRLPAPRKPWMSENSQMAVFDAVAFGLTYFTSRSVEARAALHRFP
jgi:hypothetical protein